MTQRDVFRDELGRKQKTVYTDDAGCVLYENQYVYADEKATRPNAGTQTYFRKDGTKESTEESVYDEKRGIFRPTKKTYYDSVERKEKTEHFDEMGKMSYVNEYTYESKESKNPGSCVQVNFSDGRKAMKKVAVYDEERSTFRTTRKSFYDSLERPFLTTEYDKNGCKSKEKAYTYKEDGSVFVHREQFNNGKLVAKGDFMAVNGCLLPYDMKEKRFINPSEKANTTPFFVQGFRAITPGR